MTIRYFAYGSNMARPRLEARVGRCDLIGIARLDGFDLRFRKEGRDGSGKGDIASTGRSSDAVHGVVFGLDSGQRSKLDEIEGPGYAALDVRVLTPGGAVLSAYTYAAREAALKEGLAPFDWYKAFVVQGAREHRLPPKYIAAIEAIRAVPDPDQDRAARNVEILP